MLWSMTPTGPGLRRLQRRRQLPRAIRHALFLSESSEPERCESSGYAARLVQLRNFVPQPVQSNVVAPTRSERRYGHFYASSFFVDLGAASVCETLANV